MLTIDELNSLDFEAFMQQLGNVVEHCPILAAAIWKQRPFRSVGHFISEMTGIVQALPISGKSF